MRSLMFMVLLLLSLSCDRPDEPEESPPLGQPLIPQRESSSTDDVTTDDTVSEDVTVEFPTVLDPTERQLKLNLT